MAHIMHEKFICWLLEKGDGSDVDNKDIQGLILNNAGLIGWRLLDMGVQDKKEHPVI